MRGIRVLASLWVIATLLAMVAEPARALGLGEARVDSYLNQPLDVRIRLLDASEADLDSLTVGSASPEDYQRLGLAAGALALGLQLEVDRTESPAVIRVRSERPVADPVVQLLVDARWSSGRLLREYTLFLDPPLLDIAPPPAARPAVEARDQVRDSTPPPPVRPARPAPISDEPARPAAQRAAGGDVGGERLVQSGDTLWSIARANLPSGASMDQMMIAIVELNPQAFRDGNIHQMLRGSRLTLPSAERVQAVDAASARAAVQAQNRLFNRRLEGDVPVISDAARGTEPATTSSADTSSDAPSDPAPGQRDTAAAARGPEPEGRLELVPAGDDASGTGQDGDEAEVAQLREQLARTEEELYAARLEAEDFRSRLDELETLVENNPTGAGIADAELAGLEQTLRQARLAAEEDADPALRAEVTAQLDDYLTRFESASEADSDADLDEWPAETAEIATGTDAADEAPVDERAEPEAPVVTQVGSDRGGWLSSALFWPIAGLLILLIVLAGVWFALQRRRREAAEAPAVRGASARPSAPAPARASDPVDRARNAVAERPQDLAAHLALLQALAGRGEQRAFEDALEHMFEHVESGDEPAWREAVELAGTVSPEHVLVKGSADWMAGSVDLSDEPKSEIDEESEVGDLMSRLDAEQDDESDDSDWLDDSDEPREVEDAGPMLRDTEEDDDEPLVLGDHDPDFDDLDQQVESVDEAEDESIGAGIGRYGDASTPDVGDEEAEDDWLDDELAGDAESDDARRRAGDQTKTAAEHPPERSPAVSDEDDEGMLLDWTDEAEDREAGSGAGGEAAGGSDADEGDIFAPSDDDVDVKLDLARAYLSWNSTDSAKTLLEEVVREGNPEQKEQAQKLLDDL